jgi:hypothetical protein
MRTVRSIWAKTGQADGRTDMASPIHILFMHIVQRMGKKLENVCTVQQFRTFPLLLPLDFQFVNANFFSKYIYNTVLYILRITIGMKAEIHVGLHAKCPPLLSDFNHIGTCRQVSVIFPISDFNKIHSVVLG